MTLENNTEFVRLKPTWNSQLAYAVFQINRLTIKR